MRGERGERKEEHWGREQGKEERGRGFLYFDYLKGKGTKRK